MKNWLSIVFCCAIIFSGCVTMLVDTTINDRITIEQVDAILIVTKEAFENNFIVLDTIQNDSSTIIIDIDIPLSEYCAMECSLLEFEGDMLFYNFVFNNQGLIWLVEPHFDFNDHSIKTSFLIQEGMSQNI